MNKRKDPMLVQLTVSDLVGILKKEFPMLVGEDSKSEQKNERQSPIEAPTFTGRLLYGIHGIETFFNVSHKTAHQWKESWLKPAVKQNGRKIIVDAA